MYIRLKRRALRKLPYSCVDVVILESRRTGKATSQRFIAYLGSIRDNRIQYTASRIILWDKAIHKLDTMDLPRNTREKIEQMLSRKIPHPTAAEKEWYRQRRAEIEAISANRIPLKKGLR